MTEYIVKIQFWLSCTDTLTIEASSDAEAIDKAKLEAVSVMELSCEPDYIGFDERREGSISYVDRIIGGEHEEVSEVIAFDEDRLYPDWYAFLEKVASLPAAVESAQAQVEALRQYAALIEEAKAIHGQLA